MIKKRNKNIYYLALFATICPIILSSCGSKNDSPVNYQTTSESATGIMTDNVMEAPPMVAEDAKFTEPEVREQKVMKDANVEIETLEYDVFIEDVKQLVENNKGYLESYNSSIYNEKSGLRNGYIHIKVPSESYTDVFAAIKTMGVVKSQSENAVDVTDQFYDAQSRLDNKKLQEKRLLEMMEKTQTIEDLILLEQTLGDVRTDIELYESDLNYLERNTSYSSIYVNVSEKDKISPIDMPFQDLGDKIASSFNDSISSLLLLLEWIIVAVTWLIVPVGLISILFLIFNFIRKIIKRKRNKKNNS